MKINNKMWCIAAFGTVNKGYIDAFGLWPADVEAELHRGQKGCRASFGTSCLLSAVPSGCPRTVRGTEGRIFFR